jgi:mono/diheme cytochrome c family protein
LLKVRGDFIDFFFRINFMQLSHRFLIASVFLTSILLSGCGLSLAGDITPPPNYIAPTEPPAETPTDIAPAPPQAVFPLVSPNPSQGGVIFASKCLPCHGEKGMGDGPKAVDLPNPPAKIGSPDLARKSRPVDWYNMVSSGNIQKFMPGFSESLNDSQRWDVVAYALTLSTSADDLQKGKVAYEQNCAACHGSSGQGDGTQAASLAVRPASWSSDPSRLAQLSAEDIVAVVIEGKQTHPSFADKLDDSQRYQVAAYVRSLSFSGTGKPAEASSSGSSATGNTNEIATPQTTGEATSTVDQKVTITGKVTNGTPGGKLPEGVKVKLSGFKGMQSAFDLTADAGADGAYRFENVPFESDYVYFAQVDSNGLVFNSDILHGTDITGGQANLPVQIYEAGSDPTVLRVDRMHIFFDFSKPGLVQVVNLFVISNPTDRVVIAESKDKPVIEFAVPQGASNLQFQDGQLGDGRYVQTENGFGDTQAIIPGSGQHQVLYAYDMTYDKKLDIPIKAPLPVDAAVVMLPPVGVKLKSNQLSNAGQRDVQGMSFQMYQSTASMKPGDTLTISLSGNASGGTGAAADAGPSNPLYLGIGAFALALAGGGFWLYSRRKALKPVGVGEGEPHDIVIEEPGESSDTILDAILALDDLHGSGKLPEAAYQERRAELKARLATVLDREKGR